ncbi:SAM-dependent methyltransferase [Sphingomonas glaciei]|uniref:Cyclopropane-fatty-acyl-phospholipid synthase family protein n=1 Tax=Sphingomonas glaciei TaxID=2938948 RepID=A0ABY5N094_9SPHN|nr:cyclopropane-fatty-acyl-phospholipid synthase family protein [Sphingomonas glaciei]UUR08987.1 cyclopropane-fatty-acyl-phospholipid synthase family protein [Sphingomonas glaciei]
MASRGSHLLHADRSFVTGVGLLGRLAAPAFARILDQLHDRLREGGIHGTLPDGTPRRIGFHAPGPEPVVTLHSWRALVRLATSGSVGWYKAWANGEWSSPDPVPLFDLFMRNAVSLAGTARAKGPFRLVNWLAHQWRDNAPGQARRNIAAHYDLGNDFYAAWLDPSMSYSSAMFQKPLVPSEVEARPSTTLGANGSLEVAQHVKIAAILNRLNLNENSALLEIGCGWGSLALAAARRGAHVTGLTLSTEQKAWAEARIRAEGLSDRITILLEDYRDHAGSYDALASVEMVEAVGQRWWPAYLDTIARTLRPGGRAALQYITIRPELFDAYAASADFIQTYIFPGGMLLHEPRFRALAADRGLAWHDPHAFGLDYAETLRLWRDKYDIAVEAGRLADFSPQFHDLWRYYLMYCEGGFRGQGIDVAQVTLVKA